MLHKKLYRDIKNNLSQFFTIFLMILIGVMAYSGITSYMDGMTKTKDNFYTNNNLFDIELIGNNFTKDDLEIIKNIDNVNDAERKLSIKGTTTDDKVLLLNFIESNNISKFYICEGISFDVNKSGVWLDNFYAEKNNIKVGDIIPITYDTFTINEEVLGLINIPDHLYDTVDESELYPDREKFGFAYLSINEIPEDYIKDSVANKLNIDVNLLDKYISNFNYKDYYTFNYVMVDIDDISKINEVKNNIEDNVENTLAIINREDTASDKTYQGEIDEGKTYVGVFSGLFIFIAMLSVITTMNRIIKKERIQIGTLKALGFGNKKILLHYISYGFYVSLLGVICGLLLGYFGIGKIFIDLEMSFFEIPNGIPIMNSKSYLVGLFVMLLVIIITSITIKSILKEVPAETLKNKVPNVKKGSLNLTTKKMFRKMKFSTIWNIRDILRNKLRTIMGLSGIVGCTMLIVCALGMLDSMNYFIKLQFEDIYNFNYKITLKSNITKEELNNLIDNYGDYTSKTYGIEILENNERVSNNLVVTDAKDRLRFIDNKDKFIEINNNDGVYVTYKYAKNNNLKVGDTITWHIYGSDKYYTSKIVGLNKDPQNQNMTMTRSYLESLGLTYIPDSLYTNNNEINKDNLGIELVQNIDNLTISMNSMLSMMKSMIMLIIFIAIILCIVIIYNLGILSFSEKEYQFSTLKVLGFDDKKIKNIFIKQNIWITIISIIIGLPLGYLLVDYLFKVAIEEHYDFSAYITLKTYIISMIITFVTTYIVSLKLSKKINKIDMVSSLKSNE